MNGGRYQAIEQKIRRGLLISRWKDVDLHPPDTEWENVTCKTREWLEVHQGESRWNG